MKLHLETVSSEMMQVLTRLMSIKELDSFRLVGGTALFDNCAEMLHQKIVSFENALKEKKQIEANDRDKKIQLLIEQKRKKQ